jgi:hypothetical protein
MKKMLRIGVAFALLLPLAAVADEIDSPDAVPKELRSFVAKASKAIWYSQADLDRDGKQDYLLVLQRDRPPGSGEYELQDRQRPLLVLVRGADGALHEAARNELVVLCSNCGGVMGDPFQGVEAGPGTFTVSHYGGSADRWGTSVKFNYSRKDKAWQLVRVEEENFSAFDPDKGTTRVFTPPKDFGKIDFTTFDPETFKGVGPR